MAKSMNRKAHHQFNRAALTYDAHCTVQRTMSQHAIQMLLQHQQSFDHIADFGCGTGESTRLLLRHLEYKYCYCVDFAEKLLEIAKNKFVHRNDLKWIHANFDHPLAFDQPLELIFCNLGLQWSSDVLNTLTLWKRHLQPHGFLLFSVPTINNFPELQTDVKPKFLTDVALTEMLDTVGLQVTTKQVQRVVVPFSSQFEALKSLKATGTNHHKATHEPVHGLQSLRTDRIFTDPSISQLTYDIGIYLTHRLI